MRTDLSPRNLNAQFDFAARELELDLSDSKQLFLAAVQAVNDADPDVFCFLGVHLKQDELEKAWAVDSLCTNASCFERSSEDLQKGDILYKAAVPYDSDMNSSSCFMFFVGR